MMLKIEAPKLPDGPPLAFGGSLVNQISTYRPLALECTSKVVVPPGTPSCWATVANELTEAGSALPSLPIMIDTLAPGVDPNVTVTELS